MPRRDLTILTTVFLLCCGFYILYSTAISQLGFPLDDSWIHLVFARNIATGHGFSFNPDHPVAGATAPLWTLILAFAWRIGGPIAGGMIIGSVILAVSFGYFGHFAAQFYLTDPSSLDDKGYSEIIRPVREFSFGFVCAGGIMLAGYWLMAGKGRAILENARWIPILSKLAIVAGLILIIIKSGTYANNVRNINECDVAAGKYLGGIAGPGDCVAVNDIGAIGYFSGMEIFDLKGLITSEITTDMILNDSLAFDYMRKNKRVEYLAIDPYWFKYIPKRTDLFVAIAVFVTEKNTILSGDTTKVYRAE